MSRETIVKMNFTITWLFRLISGGLVSVILYFVVDIHQEFKQYAAKTNAIENRLTKAETEINYLTKNNSRHETN